ncbi:MAG TPA: ATP-binding protein [Pyrinomonadaceae bacterium]
MEQAVEVMRESVDEPRQDGQACPKVGAVLLMPDGSVQKACRGELRDGDHAEFTLMERKNRSQRLDGSVLFTTLEPCAPDARRPPKLGCAERIVLARIKEVWVGIEDPDPKVDRKGIKYLQDAGVEVHMFDRDLQEIIREVNERFLGQALERAALSEDKKPKEVVLSTLEQPAAEGAAGDFSRQALTSYRSAAKIKERVGSQAFDRRLAQQGLLRRSGDDFVPTGFGLLLFGNEPRTAMPQAGLLGTIHYADGTEELKDFDGPQVLVPEQALEWLRSKLPNPVERSEARRSETNRTLFTLAREGLVNALVHRDYDVQGAKCQLVVTQDKIVLKSPGAPVEPITLEQMQSFNAPMLSRNPVMHHVFAQMDLAEERGLGLKSMRERAVGAGLPLPTYTWEEPYLVLTLYRSASGAARGMAPGVLEKLNKDERRGLEFLATRPSVTRKEYAEAMEFDDRKAQRHLKRFVELGLLRRVGTGPATTYELVPQ